MKNQEKFKIGDKCRVVRNPYDEQIAGEDVKYFRLSKIIHTVIEVRDTSVEAGTSGQWIRTDKENDWIDKAYFKIAH